MGYHAHLRLPPYLPPTPPPAAVAYQHTAAWLIPRAAAPARTFCKAAPPLLLRLLPQRARAATKTPLVGSKHYCLHAPPCCSGGAKACRDARTLLKRTRLPYGWFCTHLPTWFGLVYAAVDTLTVVWTLCSAHYLPAAILAARLCRFSPPLFLHCSIASCLWVACNGREEGTLCGV